MTERLHHAHYHLLRMHEMGRIVWAHTFSTFGMFMVTIFVPIFLLRSGYSLTNVLLYLAMLGLFSIPLQFVAGHIVSRIRGNHAMALSLLFQIVFFLLLLTLLSHHWPLWLLAIFWAAYRSIYWMAFNANFSKARAHKRSGRQVSLVQVIRVLATGLAPALGGILASEFGINVVYGIAIGLQVVAGLPLLTGSEVSKQRPFRPSLLKYRKIIRDLLANASNAITSMGESIIWPILVSTLVPSYAGIGILSSVLAISAIGVSVYVGRREESRGAKRYLKEGVTLASVMDVLRLVAQNAAHVFGINFFGGIGNSLYYTPFITRYYEHADEEPRLEYIAAMETAHEVGWGLFFLVLTGLSLVFSIKVVLLLGIALALPFNFGIRLIR